MEISCAVLADIIMTCSSTEPDHTAVCAALRGLGTRFGCTIPTKPICAICASPLPEESFKRLLQSNVAPFDQITCGLVSATTPFVGEGDRVPIGKNGEWFDFDCIPTIIGIGVALGTIPLITYSPIGCTMGSYSDAGGWAKVIGLFYLPYGPAFIYTPINTFYIYWMVRMQSRQSDKWGMAVVSRDSLSLHSEPKNTSTTFGLNRFRSIVAKFRRASNSISSQTESNLESQVLWLSFWYVVAFFVSYSIFFVAFPFNGYTNESDWLYILFSVLPPIQGFLNSLVYFRRRIVKWVSCGKRNTGETTKPSAFQSAKNMLIWPIVAI
jgi:hypothetical protein